MTQQAATKESEDEGEEPETGTRNVVDELVRGEFDCVPFDPSEHPGGLEWGIKTVRPDHRTRNGYVWPWPGEWTPACSDEKVERTNNGPCPAVDGDGLSVATTFAGAAQGGYNAGVGILIVGWMRDDELGADDDREKVRVRKAYVAARVDVGRWIREANLYGANLRRANLRRANLDGANLRRANLRRANLRRANLRRATWNDATTWPDGFTPPDDEGDES